MIIWTCTFCWNQRKNGRALIYQVLTSKRSYGDYGPCLLNFHSSANQVWEKQFSQTCRLEKWLFGCWFSNIYSYDYLPSRFWSFLTLRTHFQQVVFYQWCSYHTPLEGKFFCQFKNGQGLFLPWGWTKLSMKTSEKVGSRKSDHRFCNAEKGTRRFFSIDKTICPK